MISGFHEQATHSGVNTMCTNTLFPYHRQKISTLVVDRGFPPLTLQPVNFEQLYAQRMQQMMEEQGASGGQTNGEAEVTEAVFEN